MTRMASSELLIATRNQGKVREFARFLADLPVRLRSLAEFPDISEVAETGSTFSENARLKAYSYAAQTGLWTLADDSGLEVEALGGAPGLLSARYAGEGASDAARVARLLEELSGKPDEERRARFICVLALTLPPREETWVFIGRCEGRIASEPRGAHGFGYDPVFIPEGYTQTFGELPVEVKQRISHRARAVAEARACLQYLLEGELDPS